jgi:hypothetical protein
MSGLKSTDVVKWGLTGRYLSKLPHNLRSLVCHADGNGHHCSNVHEKNKKKKKTNFYPSHTSSLTTCILFINSGYVNNKWERDACSSFLKTYTACVASQRVDEHKLRTLNFHLRKVIQHRRR